MFVCFSFKKERKKERKSLCVFVSFRCHLYSFLSVCVQLIGLKNQTPYSFDKLEGATSYQIRVCRIERGKNVDVSEVVYADTLATIVIPLLCAIS